MGFAWAAVALEGFRVIAHRTWSFFVWYFVVALAFGVTGLITTTYLSVGGIEGLPPALALRVLSIPVSLIAVTLVACAVIRSILNPDDHKFAYLRLGIQEARVAALLAPVIILATGLELLGSANKIFEFVATAIVIAACTPLTLILPAIFDRGWSGGQYGLRLGRGRLRTLGYINLTAWMTIIIIKLFTGFGTYLYVNFMGSQAGGLGQSGDYAGGGIALVLILTTVRLVLSVVIMTAPAAAAYRAVTDQADPDAMAFE